MGGFGGGEGRKGLFSGRRLLFQGIAISLACAILFSCFYGVFRSMAEEYDGSLLENKDNIAWLYQSCYLLYRDLYNAKQEEAYDYMDVFLELREGYGWLLDEGKLETYFVLLNLFRELEGSQEPGEVLQEPAEAQQEPGPGGSLSESWLAEAIGRNRAHIEGLVEEGQLDGRVLEEMESGEGGIYNLSQAECGSLLAAFDGLKGYFGILEGDFAYMNNCYDYVIEDGATGQYVSNMSKEDLNRSTEEEYFRLTFSFDSAGNVTVGDDIRGMDISLLRKLAGEVAREGQLRDQMGDGLDIFLRYGKVRQPADCTITFAVFKERWASRQESWYAGALVPGLAPESVRLAVDCTGSRFQEALYWNAGVDGALLFAMLVLALLGLLFPLPAGGRSWQEERLCALSLEALVCVAAAVCACMAPVLRMVAYVASGEAGGGICVLSDNRPRNCGGSCHGAERGGAHPVFLRLLVRRAFCQSPAGAWGKAVCRAEKPDLPLFPVYEKKGGGVL